MTHLIATRLKEFWPNKAPAVLMGPWCAPAFGDDQGDNIHQGQMLPCPWSSSTVLEAYAAAQKTYLSFLPRLSCALNEIHGTSYPNRYWQILVGPWLSWFIHVIHDRFSRLQLAAELYPDLTLIGLDPHHFVTTVNSLEFVQRIHHDDLYNLQLITRLAENTEINIQLRAPKLEPELTREPSQPISQSVGWLRPAIHQFHQHLQRKASAKANIVFCSSYHSRLSLIKLFILSRGKIVDHPISSSTLTPIAPDAVKRDALKRLLFDRDSSIKQESLQSNVIEIITKELPLIFLEGYSQLETIASTEFGSYSPKAICSATAWYFNESFKCWSAKLVNCGVKVYGMQHGGTYGIFSPLNPEEHEIEITDGYFTWGWLDRQSKKPIIPISAQKLIGIKRRNSVNKEYKGILFTEMSPSRHLIFFPALPELFQAYLDWQVRFFKKIDKTTLSLTRVRLHCEDNIWAMQKRLEDVFPTLTFEGWERSFRDSLSECRLFVCDHLSTTYAEALASNTPTVIFWDPKVNQIRPEAQPIFDDLCRVGILHDTPESAAAWVEKVYPDVLGWWNKEECQRAVGNFCHNYARVSNSPLRGWLDALKKIVN